MLPQICRVVDEATARRYPSDTGDEQWALIEPLLPPVNTGGRPASEAGGRGRDLVRGPYGLLSAQLVSVENRVTASDQCVRD
jgi:hypothetical protein